MEEKIEFLKARGHKGKRYASSIRFEMVIDSPIHVVADDTIVMNVAGIDGVSSAIITLVFGQSLSIQAKDKIKITSELSPSTVTAMLERCNEEI